jgi:hypothetical protein
MLVFAEQAFGQDELANGPIDWLNFLFWSIAAIV